MKKKLFKISEHTGGATSYAVRHLRNKHNVDVGADEVAIPSKLPSLFSSAATAATAAVATSVAQAVRSTARTAKSLTPGSASVLPNREIHLEGPRLIGP